MKSSEDKIKEIEQFLVSAKDSIHRAQQLLDNLRSENIVASSNILQGTFDGEKVIGLDGKEYSVKGQFAAKSKLIKGDTIEVGISLEGENSYKVIGNAPRREIIGDIHDKGGYFIANSEEKNYKVLNEAIEYYDLLDGDKVALVVPKDTDSDWAAIEGLIDEAGYGPEVTTAPEVKEEATSEPVAQTDVKENNSDNTVTPPVEPAKPEVTQPLPETSEAGSISNLVPPQAEIVEPQVEKIIPQAASSVSESQIQQSNYDQDLANEILDRPSNVVNGDIQPTGDTKSQEDAVPAQGIKELDI